MLGGALMLLALAAASAMPTATPEEDEVLYDQRQNGTDNYRVQVSDVTFVVAPAEALFAVSPTDLFESQIKPKLTDSNKTSRISTLDGGNLRTSLSIGPKSTSDEVRNLGIGTNTQGHRSRHKLTNFILNMLHRNHK